MKRKYPLLLQKLTLLVSELKKKEYLLFGTKNKKSQEKDVNIFAVVTIINDTSTEISNYRILTRSLVR